MANKCGMKFDIGIVKTGMTFTGTMLASSVSAIFGLTIDSPTFVERGGQFPCARRFEWEGLAATVAALLLLLPSCRRCSPFPTPAPAPHFFPGGHGIAVHEMIFRMKISIPSLQMQAFNLAVTRPRKCGPSCHYVDVGCIACRTAFDIAVPITERETRKAFNNIFKNGLNQFTEDKDSFIDLKIDVGGLVNAALKDVSIAHPLIGGVCSIFNGCGGKTLDAMVTSGVVWSQVMFAMFILMFGSCCLSCYCRSQYKKAKPMPPKSIREGHAALEKSRDRVDVTLPYAWRLSKEETAASGLGLGNLVYKNGAVIVPKKPTTVEAPVERKVLPGDAIIRINGKRVEPSSLPALYLRYVRYFPPHPPASALTVLVTMARPRAYTPALLFLTNL